MGWLEGEVALITGGASGIGRAVARRFVEEGARVCVADIAGDRLAELRDELGDSVTTIEADVRTIGENKKMVRHCVDAFGKLDILCPNAGLSDSFREFVDIPEDDLADVYDELYDVNVKATLLGVKAALPELVKTNGCVIFTLSNSSFWPDGGGVMYISSKHAALGAMRQLAHEFAPTVRVNGVAPGGTKTDIRLPESLGVDEHGNPIRAHAHPSNADDAVERVTPLRMHALPEDHTGAFVLAASRKEGRAMAGSVIDTTAGLGIRGLRRVRGGDDLRERVLGGE
jgi:2,3-dihydroxy-2,3-dihydrophenylpropionate dehydrogenase